MSTWCVVGQVACAVAPEGDPQRGPASRPARLHQAPACFPQEKPGDSNLHFVLLLFLGRQVQNVHTGLDLSVPQHQEVRGKMLSGHVEYQILVVTRLAAFKSAKHKPEDVVQFLVSGAL